MFRLALIAYLSLTTVLGPLLCCCNAQQLATFVGGSQCCGKRVAQQTAPENTEHAGHSYHGHSHHKHEHSPETEPSQSKQAPVPHKHNGQNCPCGKHHASLVAAATNIVQLNAVELQAQTWNVLVAILPVAVDFEEQTASINTHLRPAKLYGREMLRAYSIMRC
jgi:hypothetical protein